MVVDRKREGSQTNIIFHVAEVGMGPTYHERKACP